MKVGEALKPIQADGWSLVTTRGITGSSSMRYAIVIEQAEGNYSAYVPDVPGCVATGATIEEVESEMREAIAFHIDGMKEDGLPIPIPSSQVEYLDIAA